MLVAAAATASLQQQQQQVPPGMVGGGGGIIVPPPYLQPRVGRLPTDRPLIKLSLSLIDTYKHINTVYYEEREARRAARVGTKGKMSTTTTTGAAAAVGSQQQQIHSKRTGTTGAITTTTASKQQQQQQQHTTTSSHPHGGPSTGAAGSVPSSGGGTPGGPNNDGWDDENYDYIITAGELFYKNRYRLQERIGKGSFGQVVRAVDVERNADVAIKIIKSKRPFLMQAKTEIELLTHLNERDADDQHNVGTYTERVCMLVLCCFFVCVYALLIFRCISPPPTSDFVRSH